MAYSSFCTLLTCASCIRVEFLLIGLLHVERCGEFADVYTCIPACHPQTVTCKAACTLGSVYSTPRSESSLSRLYSVIRHLPYKHCTDCNMVQMSVAFRNVSTSNILQCDCYVHCTSLYCTSCWRSLLACANPPKWNTRITLESVFFQKKIKNVWIQYVWIEDLVKKQFGDERTFCRLHSSQKPKLRDAFLEVRNAYFT